MSKCPDCKNYRDEDELCPYHNCGKCENCCSDPEEHLDLFNESVKLSNEMEIQNTKNKNKK